MKTTKCELCGSETLMAYYPILFRVECMSAECHLTGPLRESEELAAQDWNDLCEWIRVGKEMLALVSAGMQLGVIQIHEMCDEETQREWSQVVVELEPIPEAPPDPLDVLRECKEYVIQTIGMHGGTDEARCKLRKKINAVLEQAKETDK